MSSADTHWFNSGDEIVEWNGVPLRNKPDVVVQDIISHWSGEIELTVRLDKQPYKLPTHRSSRLVYSSITALLALTVSQQYHITESHPCRVFAL